MRTVLQHVVIFKLENYTDQQLEEAQKQTAIMVETIPGIISASFAENVTSPLYDGYKEHTKGFTHTLLVTFVDKEALKGYDRAPTHLKLGDMVIPFVKEVVCTDTLIDTYPE